MQYIRIKQREKEVARACRARGFFGDLYSPPPPLQSLRYELAAAAAQLDLSPALRSSPAVRSMIRSAMAQDEGGEPENSDTPSPFPPTNGAALSAEQLERKFQRELRRVS